MKQEELNLILENHKKWLNREEGGIRANLRGSDLSDADLSRANLCGADLCGADLRGADLCGSDLCDADLRGADLCGSDLCDADLSRANLRGSDLSRANLRGSDLWSTIGNQKEIITIQTDVWQIVYTKEVVQIGCQRHSIKDWFEFSDERIAEMDRKAPEFWNKWKPILALILEREYCK
jgi:uncharacterized protein YjbI with pentapeptide repeats